MREISTLISENRSQLGADGGNLYSELSLMHKRRCGTVASIKDILSLVKHPRNFFNEHLHSCMGPLYTSCHCRFRSTDTSLHF